MASQEQGKKSIRAMFSAIPPKAKWLIYLTSFSSVGFGYFFITVSAYYAQLGIDGSAIGLILGASGAASILTAIPMGIYADKHGRKILFILGMFAIPPMLLIFAFTTDVLFLVIAAIGAGIGEGAFMSCWNALIADMNTPQTRTAAFSLSFIVGSATSALGFLLPFFFPYMVTYLGANALTIHSDFFIVVALLAVISPVTLMILLRGYREIIKPGGSFIKRGKNLPTILKFSACSSMIGLGAGFIIPLIPTWLNFRFDVLDSVSGPLLAASNVLMALAAMVSTSLAVRYGSVRSIVLTQSLATLFMFVLAYAGEPLLAGAIYLVRAALMNMASPISDSYLMSIITPEERGFASSINAIVWRLPNSISTVVGGSLLKTAHEVDPTYYYYPFFLAAGFYAVATIALYVLFKRVKPIS